MKVLRGDKNQCGVCNEYFNSSGAFEKHRTGKHGVNRRCMSREEMLAAGMSVNDKGFWVGMKWPDRLRKHYEHNDVEEGSRTV
jgi:hypothetical protein